MAVGSISGVARIQRVRGFVLFAKTGEVNGNRLPRTSEPNKGIWYILRAMGNHKRT